MKAFLKAFTGAAAAASAALVTAASGGHITLVEWLIATNAALVGFNAVYWTPNKPEAPFSGGNIVAPGINVASMGVPVLQGNTIVPPAEPPPAV